MRIVIEFKKQTEFIFRVAVLDHVAEARIGKSVSIPVVVAGDIDPTFCDVFVKAPREIESVGNAGLFVPNMPLRGSFHEFTQSCFGFIQIRLILELQTQTKTAVTKIRDLIILRAVCIESIRKLTISGVYKDLGFFKRVPGIGGIHGNESVPVFEGLGAPVFGDIPSVG